MQIVRTLTATVAAIALGLGLGAVRSDAASITDLYGTGVDSSGVTLGDDALDTHYTITPMSNTGTPASANVVNSNSFPFPLWVANDPVGTSGGSMWISGPDGGVNAPNGIYDYRTTFTIQDGFAPSTASITGLLTADDRVSVLLNGQPVVSLTLDEGYGQLYKFAINSGFVSGTNTLDFLVENTHGGPEGLRVSMSGTVVNGVPEPASLVLMGLGTVGLLGYVGLRRKAG